MADITVFPGGKAPHETARQLERRGYRVDPRTGRATPAPAEHVDSEDPGTQTALRGVSAGLGISCTDLADSLLSAFRGRPQQHEDQDHVPDPAA